jgi:hypothetical protein
MRNSQISFLTLLFLVFQAGSVSVESSEREAVLSIMDKAFAAVRSSRPEDWRAIQWLKEPHFPLGHALAGNQKS